MGRVGWIHHWRGGGKEVSRVEFVKNPLSPTRLPQKMKSAHKKHPWSFASLNMGELWEAINMKCRKTVKKVNPSTSKMHCVFDERIWCTLACSASNVYDHKKVNVLTKLKHKGIIISVTNFIDHKYAIVIENYCYN